MGGENLFDNRTIATQTYVIEGLSWTAFARLGNE